MFSQDHVVFFIHGLFGSPLQLELFQQKCPETILYHACKINNGLLGPLTGTIDGISEGTKRILTEIEEVILKNPNLHKISIIATSLGGLYAREVIGMFYEQNKEKFLNGELQFNSFITLASPHLGTSSQLSIPLAILSYFTKSTRELNLLDSQSQKLLNLSQGKYFEALQMFKQRVLYAPLINDGVVTFQSSGLSLSFPHEYDELVKKKQKNFSNFEENNHIIKEELLTPDTVNEELQSQNKFYNTFKKSQIMEEIFKNLRKLTWQRVSVLLDHTVLSNQRKPKWYYMRKKYSINYRQDVMNNLINKLQ